MEDDFIDTKSVQRRVHKLNDLCDYLSVNYIPDCLSLDVGNMEYEGETCY